MATYNKFVGDFQLNDSTGNQSITGVGFEPTLVIFYATPDTVDVTSQIANLYGMVGVTDGSNQQAMSFFSTNGAAFSDTYYQMDDTHCITMNESGVLYSATIVSLDADGFTINLDDAPADVYRVGYLALGGDFSVKMGNFTAPASTGTDATTGVGFQPDALILWSLSQTDTLGSSVRGSHIKWTYGFSDGTNDVSMGLFDEDGQSISDSHRVMSSAAVLHALDRGGTPLELNASVDSFDADGFTLNYTRTQSGSQVFYVALAGPSFKAGAVQLNDSTGNQTVSGVGFQPNCTMFLSSGQNSLASVSADLDGGKYSLGIADPDKNMYTIGGTTEDGETTTDCDHHQHNDYISRIFDYATTAEEDVALDNYNSDGFILNLTTADASPSYLGYLAMQAGDEGSGGGGNGNGDNPTGGSGGSDSPDSSFFYGWVGT